jgi:hypothetical protein
MLWRGNDHDCDCDSAFLERMRIADSCPFEKDQVPLNGLPINCRERAAETHQKASDLAREAVSCNAVFGEN